MKYNVMTNLEKKVDRVRQRKFFPLTSRIPINFKLFIIIIPIHNKFYYERLFALKRIATTVGVTVVFSVKI